MRQDGVLFGPAARFGDDDERDAGCSQQAHQHHSACDRPAALGASTAVPSFGHGLDELGSDLGQFALESALEALEFFG